MLQNKLLQERCERLPGRQQRGVSQVYEGQADRNMQLGGRDAQLLVDHRDPSRKLQGLWQDGIWDVQRGFMREPSAGRADAGDRRVPQ